MAIVGTGPNGLAAGVTLARAGLRVELYEAAATIGGGLRGEAYFDSDIRHDVCSAVHPMAAASPFFREFALAGARRRTAQPARQLRAPAGRRTRRARLPRSGHHLRSLGADGPRLAPPDGAAARTQHGPGRLLHERPALRAERPDRAAAAGEQAARARHRLARRTRLAAAPRARRLPRGRGPGAADRRRRARRRQAADPRLRRGRDAAGAPRARHRAGRCRAAAASASPR